MWGPLLMLLAAAAEGRPLFYWGSRAPVIEAEKPRPSAPEAALVEVHAALDGPVLVLRFTFDRPVARALRLADGTPVSGRLRAVLYVDLDDDRKTGLAGGERELRAGADRRLDLGVLTVGEDPEEGRKATAVVTAQLFALTPEGRQRSLWRGDDQATPLQVAVRGDAVELRLLAEKAPVAPAARLVLARDDQVWSGRLAPGAKR